MSRIALELSQEWPTGLDFAENGGKIRISLSKQADVGQPLRNEHGELKYFMAHQFISALTLAEVSTANL